MELIISQSPYNLADTIWEFSCQQFLKNNTVIEFVSPKFKLHKSQLITPKEKVIFYFSLYYNFVTFKTPK